MNNWLITCMRILASDSFEMVCNIFNSKNYIYPSTLLYNTGTKEMCQYLNVEKTAKGEKSTTLFHVHQLS